MPFLTSINEAMAQHQAILLGLGIAAATLWLAVKTVKELLAIVLAARMKRSGHTDAGTLNTLNATPPANGRVDALAGQLEALAKEVDRLREFKHDMNNVVIRLQGLAELREKNDTEIFARLVANERRVAKLEGRLAR